MALGPIELLVIKFPGNKFSGEITPALSELVDSGMIRIIDLAFIHRADDEVIRTVEISEIDELAQFDASDSPEAGLLSDEDILLIGQALGPNSSAGILLFENVWATRFQQAIVAAHGELIMNERIPRAVVEAALAAWNDEATQAIA